MFKKDKKYKFSFRKLQEDYARKKLPVGNIMRRYEGANIKVSNDGKEGMIHGTWTAPEIIEFNGAQMPTGRVRKEEICLLVPVEWCEEV